MKIFSSLIIAIVITMSAISGYCGETTVLTHNVDYEAWVCDWCSSSTASATVNFPSNNDSSKYKVKYYLKASNMQYAKVVITITKSGGASQDIQLWASEPNNDLEIGDSDHPVTITSTVDCSGAGLWDDVKATVTITQTSPYGN